jgi:hypothetical protein
MLAPPGQRRERILVMGAWGTWKTTSWLQIAKFAKITGSPMKFYAIDTDGALEAFIGSGQYANLDNVTVYDAFEWEEYKSALADIQKRITPEDWSIVDFISPAWDAVQSDYIEQIYKSGPAEYYMEYRRAKASGQPLDGWKDWSVINRNYREWQTSLVKKTPGHKFWTANPAAVGDNDDKAVRATFGAYGVKPKGQKELGHLPHTVLLFQSIKPGEVMMTTIKDREREPLELVKFDNFVLDYLVKLGGWTL